MTKEALLEVVRTLAGPIHPNGDFEDEKRYSNLKDLCWVINNLVSSVDIISYKYQNSKQASAKKSSTSAYDFLTKKLGISK